MSLPCPTCGIHGPHYCPGPRYQEQRNAWHDSTPQVGESRERCAHESCTQCHGSGNRIDGRGSCVHMIACPCPKHALRLQP